MMSLSVSAQRTSPAASQTSPQLPDAPSSGSISGSVADSGGGLVPDADITVQNVATGQKQGTQTDDDGRFRLSGVPSGDFTMSIKADGLEPLSKAGTLHPGEQYAMPTIVLRVAMTNTDVQVSVSQDEIAEAEVKVEEKQRLIGVVPNFYVTYNWHAEPLSPKQKSELAYRSLFDWTTFAFTGAVAGIQYGQGSLDGFGYGPGGYFKRYAADFGNVFVGNLLGGAILPIVFKQDPRYFYKGTGTIRSRLLYALSTAVIARGDNGKWQPAYANILGNFAAGAISNVYYPSSSRQGVSLTLENASIGIAFDGFGNVFQEFLLKRFTPSTTKAAKAQP
jgi:hypothetical protein